MVQVFYTEKHQIKTPLYECRIIVEERWVDNEGNIYYKALLLFDTIPFDKPVRKERWLIKLNPLGDTFEKTTYGSATLGYPDDVDSTTGHAYTIHYSQ
jgi:hypothetical protein